jgi:hypothetical protein
MADDPSTLIRLTPEVPLNDVMARAHAAPAALRA